MKNVIIAVTVVMLLAGSACADYLADPKWSQKPEEGVYGYDFSSETLVPSEVADDFQCNSPAAITTVHWWGSYYCDAPLLDKNSDTYTDPSFQQTFTDPTPPTGAVVMPGVVAGFTLTFYADIPALQDPSMPHSHPDQAGQYMTPVAQYVDVSLVTSNMHGIIDRDGNGTYGDIGDEVIWQYCVELPIPFEQVEDTIYWLSIIADNDEGNSNNVQWGWHEAVQDDQWNDFAVQNGPGDWGIDYENLYWVNLAPKDMAFELGIPEPATMALVGGGLAAMVMARRNRKHAAAARR